MILIGEEGLPHALRKYERVHNRVLDWAAAQPCDARDASLLVPKFCPGISVGSDLLNRIVKASGGRPRRIAVNLAKVCEYCTLEGLNRIDSTIWGDRPLFSGDPPGRRVGAA